MHFRRISVGVGKNSVVLLAAFCCCLFGGYVSSQAAAFPCSVVHNIS